MEAYGRADDVGDDRAGRRAMIPPRPLTAGRLLVRRFNNLTDPL